MALPHSLLLPGHEISGLALPHTPLQRSKATCPHDHRLDSLKLQVTVRLYCISLCAGQRSTSGDCPQVTVLRCQSSCFLRQGPSLAWSLLISPDWLASEPQRFICFFSGGIPMVCFCAWLLKSMFRGSNSSPHACVASV